MDATTTNFRVSLLLSPSNMDSQLTCFSINSVVMEVLLYSVNPSLDFVFNTTNRFQMYPGLEELTNTILLKCNRMPKYRPPNYISPV